MTPKTKRSISFEVAFAALSIYAAAPLWIVERPPIQDLPQHAATLRILSDYANPSLRFEEFFEIGLLRTQYLAYYGLAWLIALCTNVLIANKILLSAAIVGTHYAARSLLRALGRPERMALFLVPLTWNAHLILGFLNFVAAIPLCLVGLTLAVRLRQHASPWRAGLLSAIALLTFYTHVVPFGLLGIGATMVLCGGGLRPTLLRLATLAPAGLATLVWTQTSPAGISTLEAARNQGSAAVASYARWGDSLREAPMWLTDVLVGTEDDRVLVYWALLALMCVALGCMGPTNRAETPEDKLRASLVRRVGFLAPLSALLYFVLPTGYSWIWPINARFALLSLIFIVVSLPSLRGFRAAAVTLALLWLSWTSTSAVTKAFVQVEAQEQGDLQAAIEQVEPGSRVAGLMFDRGSQFVKFSPFLHSVAWVQAERGGAAMFTFADFPQSPVRFRQESRPPRVPPRWEWMPERVDPARDLAWYDYVLVRGGPGRIARERAFQRVFQGDRWSLWTRRRPSPAETGGF